MGHLRREAGRNIGECGEYRLKTPGLFVPGNAACLVRRPAFLLQEREADILRLVGGRVVRGDKDHRVHALLLSVIDDRAVALLEYPFTETVPHDSQANVSCIAIEELEVEVRAEEIPDAPELCHRDIAPPAPELHKFSVSTGVYRLVERVYFFFCPRVALVCVRALGIGDTYLLCRRRVSNALLTKPPERLRHVRPDIAAEGVARERRAGILDEPRERLTDDRADQVPDMHLLECIWVGIFDDDALTDILASLSKIHTFRIRLGDCERHCLARERDVHESRSGNRNVARDIFTKCID